MVYRVRWHPTPSLLVGLCRSVAQTRVQTRPQTSGHVTRPTPHPAAGGPLPHGPGYIRPSSLLTRVVAWKQFRTRAASHLPKASDCRHSAARFSQLQIKSFRTVCRLKCLRCCDFRQRIIAFFPVPRHSAFSHFLKGSH